MKAEIEMDAKLLFLQSCIFLILVFLLYHLLLILILIFVTMDCCIHDALLLARVHCHGQWSHNSMDFCFLVAYTADEVEYKWLEGASPVGYEGELQLSQV